MSNDRRGPGRRKHDKVAAAIVAELAELAKQPNEGDDGSQLRALLARASALDSEDQPTKVCAWCQTVMSNGSEAVSHGMCAECEANMNSQLEPKPMKRLLDVNVRSLIHAAEEYDLKVYEVTPPSRVRGTFVEVILVDEDDETLARVRVYERIAQILGVSKYGAPDGTRSSDGTHWTAAHDSPANFRREMFSLVMFYVYRREGQEVN